MPDRKLGLQPRNKPPLMSRFFRAVWRIPRCLFNAIRNLSLAFTCLLLLAGYLIAQNPEGFIETLEEIQNRKHESFCAYGDFGSRPGHQHMIRVGGKRRYEEFPLCSLVFLEVTKGKPHYVDVALKDKLVSRLNGDIKHIRASIPKGARGIYTTGSSIINLAYFDGLSSNQIAFSVKLKDSFGKTYEVVIPAYKRKEFLTAYTNFKAR